MKNIYNKIKGLCDNREINVTQLEKGLGLGNGTIRRWDVSSPSINKLVKVANYFDVSIDYIIGNDSSNVIYEKYPEGVELIRRASNELEDIERKRLTRIIRAFLNEE